MIDPIFYVHHLIQYERSKLKAKNHPRIKVEGTKTTIDTWCDGNEEEAARVIKMTRKYRTLVDEAYNRQQAQV